MSLDLNDLEARIAENEKHGLYTSPAAKELIKELKYLRGERAAVVAYLRASRSQRWASAIQRGEHRREEEE